MWHPILRTLCAVALAGSLGEAAPTSVATAPLVTSTLSVELSCRDDGSSCEAYATGGSGGYTFTWTNAIEWRNEYGYSAAIPQCTEIMRGVFVQVTVADSAGGTTTEGIGARCPS